MSGMIPTLAEAVTAAINSATLTPPVNAAIRRWLPKVKLEDLGNEIKLYVVARGIETTPLTRAKDSEVVSIDVGLFKRINGNQEAEIDQLFGLIDQIHGVLRRSFDSVPASWIGRTSDPIFDVGALEENGVLRSVTTYRYTVHRDVRV